MTIWSVEPVIYTDNSVRYKVLPYSLGGTIKCMKMGQLVEFFKHSYFSEKKARKYAEYRNKQHDIQW